MAAARDEHVLGPCNMRGMFARCCDSIDTVVVLCNAALGAGLQARNATQVRLLRRDNQRMQMTIDELFMKRERGFMLSNIIHNFRISLVGSLLLCFASTSATTAEKHVFEAESAEPIGGASNVTDGAASGGTLV